MVGGGLRRTVCIFFLWKNIFVVRQRIVCILDGITSRTVLLGIFKVDIIKLLLFLLLLSFGSPILEPVLGSVSSCLSSFQAVDLLQLVGVRDWSAQLVAA